MNAYKLPAFMQKRRVHRCFVCNTPLEKENYTLEHLIPQWMIRMFHLESESVALPSGKTVSYIDFVVPCCRECNCHLLSPIEASLARYMSHSNRNSTKVPTELLAIWVCKVLAGARLYWHATDETASMTDSQRRFITIGRYGRKKPREPKTVPAAEMCQQYLRMLRGKVNFAALMQDFPFSVFFFRTKVPRARSERFDFKIVSYLDAIYIRLGRWSVLARSDGGYISLYGESFYVPFIRKKLAPLQMEELAAHFFTMAERQNYPLLFHRRWDNDMETIVFINVTLNRPFASYSGADDFLAWFSELTRIPKEKLSSPGQRWTFLKDQDGKVLDIPADRKNCFAPL